MRTHAFLGPLLPYLWDTKEPHAAEVGFREVGADYFYVDRLNLRFGVWVSLRSLLQEHLPHLVGEYRKILFDERVRSDYSQRHVSTVLRLARKQGLDDKIRLRF